MKKTEARYKSLHLRAGYACNNDCVFCCDSAETSALRLAPEVARQMLVDNVSLGTVVFTCHEPTLNPDLVQLVAWAAELGYENVSLVTNGRRLAKGDLAARLVAAGLSTVDISVHGHEAAVHDGITRRPGSFDEAVAGIEAMRDQRARHPLTLKLLSTVSAKLVEAQASCPETLTTWQFQLYSRRSLSVVMNVTVSLFPDIVFVSMDSQPGW